MDTCRNCNSHRGIHKVYRRGFCRRCYYRIRNIERIKDGTFKRKGRFPKLTEFETKYLPKRYEEELKIFRKLEAGLNEDASPMEVEGLLCSITKALRSEPTFAQSCHSTFADCFDQNQRNLLYELFLDILENSPHGKYKKIDYIWK